MSAEVTGRRASLEERRRFVAESLRVSNPGNNARDLPTQADPRHDCAVELAVDEIKPYDHNPRRSNNAKFDEIKESIRACGIRNPIAVTRRPGEQHFIIEAGGNTRLTAIQELWAETRDPRFRKLTALFRPWRSESHVLTAHLIENEQRGEMTFWDKACGVVTLKAQLEAEKGRALTLRQLEDELRIIGMSVNTATLAHCLFATDRLRILGEAHSGLSGLDVKTLQPRLNLLKRYAQMRGPLAETELYATVFEPAFKRYVDDYRQTQAFSAAAICEVCEEALAQHLQEPVTQLQANLRSLVQSSTSLESATSKSNGSRPVLPAQPPPTTNSHTPQHTVDVGTGSTELTRSTTPVHSHDVAAHLRAEKLATRESFIEQVRRFATLAGVADYLCLDAKAPRGYLMQALSLPDRDSQHRCKRRAWGLLALIAGQLRDGACGSLAQSTAESNSAAHPDAECMLRALLAIDHDFVSWLLDAHDEAAEAFCGVVAMVRELPTACEFGVTSGPNPQSKTD